MFWPTFYYKYHGIHTSEYPWFSIRHLISFSSMRVCKTGNNWISVKEAAKKNHLVVAMPTKALSHNIHITFITSFWHNFHFSRLKFVCSFWQIGAVLNFRLYLYFVVCQSFCLSVFLSTYLSFSHLSITSLLWTVCSCNLLKYENIGFEGVKQ